MLSQLTLSVALVLTSVASAIVALAVVASFTGRGSRRQPALSDAVLDRVVFLFEDRELIDATEPAKRLLHSAPQAATDWDRLIAALAPNFDGLAGRLAALAGEGTVDLVAPAGSDLRLIAQNLGRAVRIELADANAANQGVVSEAAVSRALEVEAALLREVVSASPALAWRYDSAGVIDWANRSYLRRAADHLGVPLDAMTWPLPDLLPVAAAPAGGDAQRQRVASVGTVSTQWYERQSHPSGAGTLHFATPADQTVKAETALREFVQTLTKTFAHLPIGLAILDRHRQLALFNPALSDLTTLGPEFLSSRPTLFSFLDTLREARMIPEPKDYRSWRQTMTELEKAAASGLYEEMWTLPTGQTYHVIGRPHPDGAVAFLLEDITAEISLTRRFRSEIELGHEVLDVLPDAIAVFSPAGLLEQSNSAYAALWGIDPTTTLGTIGIAEATRHWQALTRPTDLWAAARGFVLEVTPQREFGGDVILSDGRCLRCHFVTLTSGATVARFQESADAERPVRRIRRRPRVSELFEGLGA